MKQNFGLLGTLLVLGFLISIVSCMHEESFHVIGANDKEIFIRLKSPGDIRPETYAMDISGEQQITSLRVLAFVYNGTDYMYAYSRVATLSFQNGNDAEFKVALVGYKGLQKLVILANCSDEIIAATITESDNIASAMNKFIVRQDNEWPVNTENDNQTQRSIPMCAYTEAMTVDESLTEIGSASDPLIMIRMLARIDISLKESIANFKLLSASLFNRKNKGYIAYNNTPSHWDYAEEKALRTYIPVDIVTTKLPSVDAYYQANYPNVESKGEIMRTIYTFEASGVSEKSEATAIVIGGYFNYPANQSKITYYRIDIPQYNGNTPIPGTMGDILRNYLYNVIIQKFTTPGADTEEKAFDGSITMNATVVGWNMADMDDTSFGRYYGLKVDPAVVITDKTGAMNKSFSVFTDYPEGWKASLEPTTALSWITLGQADLDGKAGVTAELKFNILSNTTGMPRHAFLKVRAGGLIKYIDIFQAENLTGNIFDWTSSELESETDPEGTFRLGISRSNYEFYKNAGADIPLMISTDHNKGWTATSSAAWLRITKNGTVTTAGSEILLFNVDENTGGDRSAYIYIIAGNMHKTVYVRQSSKANETGNTGILPWETCDLENDTGVESTHYLDISRSNYELYKNVGTGLQLIISTDYQKGFTAVSSAAWLRITENSTSTASGSKTLLFNVDENTGGDRSAYIYITAGNMHKTVYIRQSSKANETGNTGILPWEDGGQENDTGAESTHYLDISRSNCELYKNAGTGFQLVISTDYQKGFTAVSSAAWLRITENSTSTASGSKTLLFNVDENTGGDRSAYIYITAGNMHKTVYVRQSSKANETGNTGILPWEDGGQEDNMGLEGAHTLILERNNCIYDGGAKSRTVNVTADGGGKWTATTTASWIDLTTATGLANGTATALAFNILAYPEGNDRTGMIIVKSGNLEKRIRITQYAGPAIIVSDLLPVYEKNDDKIQKFIISAKSRWRATIISDPNGIMQQLRTPSGNVSENSDFPFTLRTSNNTDYQTVTIGFSAYADEFDRMDFTLGAGVK